MGPLGLFHRSAPPAALLCALLLAAVSLWASPQASLLNVSITLHSLSIMRGAPLAEPEDGDSLEDSQPLDPSPTPMHEAALALAPRFDRFIEHPPRGRVVRGRWRPPRSSTVLPRAKAGGERFLHVLSVPEGMSGWLDALSEVLVLGGRLNRTVVLPCVRAGALVPCFPGRVLPVPPEGAADGRADGRNFSASVQRDAAAFPAFAEDCAAGGLRLPRARGRALPLHAYFSRAGIAGLRARAAAMSGLAARRLRVVDFAAWAAASNLPTDGSAHSLLLPAGAPGLDVNMRAGTLLPAQGPGARAGPWLLAGGTLAASVGGLSPHGRGLGARELRRRPWARQRDILCTSWNRVGGLEKRKHAVPLPPPHPAHAAAAAAWLYAVRAERRPGGGGARGGRALGRGARGGARGGAPLGEPPGGEAPRSARGGAAGGGEEEPPTRSARGGAAGGGEEEEPSASAIAELGPRPSPGPLPGAWGAPLPPEEHAVLSSSRFAVVQWRSETLGTRRPGCAREVAAFVGALRGHQRGRPGGPLPLVLVSDLPAPGNPCTPSFTYEDSALRGARRDPLSAFAHLGMLKYDAALLAALRGGGAGGFIDAGVVALREYALATRAETYATCNLRFAPRHRGAACRRCSWGSEFIYRTVLARQRERGRDPRKVSYSDMLSSNPFAEDSADDKGRGHV